MSKQPLFLFNSMGRKIEEFIPIQPGEVHLYTCGLTVYNYAHLGNLRAYIFTDTLRRILQWKDYDVLHVMNITDVGHLTSDADSGEDKMEKAAEQQQRSIWEIAEYFTNDFKANLERLNVMPPSVWTKATDHIQEMLCFARVLEMKGYTYILDDGLYFDTSKVKDYGRLALMDAEGQKEARVAANEGKRRPSDFAIWRFSPKDKQRLMEWHSPWGVGAPGWHLECSVMSLKYLGHHFDIHTGGVDHRQIHHVNEIAQNQAYLDSDDSGVNYWLHNEFLILNEEKMSKSTGDFLRLQTLMDWGIHPLSFRYFSLMATYRTQLLFSREAISSARNGLKRLLKNVEDLKVRAGEQEWLKIIEEVAYSKGSSFSIIKEYLLKSLSQEALSWIDKFDEAISRDLNTPQALALLSSLVQQGQLPADSILRIIAVYDLVFGLSLLELNSSDINLRPHWATLDEAEIMSLIAERQEARRQRKFRPADEIRQRLLEKGVIVEDTPVGAIWEWASLSDEARDEKVED
jgi:cysteinyl-tRNA synthetase